MEKTRHLTANVLSDAPAPSAGGGAEPLVRAFAGSAMDPARAGRLWLDFLLEKLDFENAFLFAEGGGKEALIAAAVRAGFEGVGEPKSSAGSGSHWALASESVRRELMQSGVGVFPSGSEPCARAPADRAALLFSLPLYGELRAIVVLERALDAGQVAESERELFEALCLSAGAAFRGVYCCAELEKLSKSLGGPDGPSSPAVSAAREAPHLDAEDAEPAPEIGELPDYYGMIGKDEKFLKVIRIVEKIKDTDLNVCILGESGTGKEMLAQAIHKASRRRDKKFIAESCASIPENLLESELFGHVRGAFTGADEDRKGLFELASGGTLFLDEIADMSEGMQRKLLRVLEEGVVRPIGGKQPIRIDTRVISASNRDLRSLVQKNLFRADLYYRLNVVTIELPPLRERPSDIPLLIAHVCRKVEEEEGIRKRFSKSAMAALKAYSWPGNVRELANVVRRALLVSQGKLVSRRDVAALLKDENISPRFGMNVERREGELILRIPARETFNDIVEECERLVLWNALNECGWNKSKVTKMLRIPRQSLYNKIARYKLERDWKGFGESQSVATGAGEAAGKGG